MAAHTLATAFVGNLGGLRAVHKSRDLKNSRKVNSSLCCQLSCQGSFPSEGRRKLSHTVVSRKPMLQVKARGFGDKLMNFVTGNAAKISVSISPEDRLSMSKPFDAKIVVDAESDIKYNKIFIKVECYEKIDNFYVNTADFSDRVTDSNRVFSQEIPVADAGELSAGENVEWDVQVVLPSDVNPSFEGINISCEWTLRAEIGTGLSGGKNPSSGNLKIHVSP